MWLLLAIVAIPVIEIAIFIQVGGLIGIFPTLALVLLMTMAGTMLVRSQGAQTGSRLRRALAEGSDPSNALAHAAMILLAGALLVIPGFFTDLIGLTLLIPQVRLAAFARLRRRIGLRGWVGGPAAQARGGPATGDEDEVIDGTYEDLTPGKRPTHQPSGWTRH